MPNSLNALTVKVLLLTFYLCGHGNLYEYVALNIALVGFSCLLVDRVDDASQRTIVIQLSIF